VRAPKSKIDWSRYPNFSEEEFRCKATGRCDMDIRFMDRLQRLRTRFNQPLFVTSGYRHVSHPAESQKGQPGAHTFGRAADLAVSHEDAYRLVGMAIEMGFTGIGVQQKGSGRFVHLDDLEPGIARPRPTIWSY
jgi:zinc D-Ala-D-Ala carboxypeptidase